MLIGIPHVPPFNIEFVIFSDMIPKTVLLRARLVRINKEAAPPISGAGEIPLKRGSKAWQSWPFRKDPIFPVGHIFSHLT